MEQAIKQWVAIASTEDLQAKFEEYSPERRDLSPRDSETRAKLATVIRLELLRRAAT